MTPASTLSRKYLEESDSPDYYSHYSCKQATF